MSRLEDIQEEVARIKKTDPRGASTDAIIDFARKNKGSAIYEEFANNGAWDKDKAQEQFLQIIARKILRVSVIVLTPPKVSTVVSVKQYISLSDRRGEGYEDISEVLKSPERAEVLLHDVITRLLSIKEVALFEELQQVHRAIQRAAALYMKEEKEEASRSRAGQSARV